MAMLRLVPGIIKSTSVATRYDEMCATATLMVLDPTNAIPSTFQSSDYSKKRGSKTLSKQGSLLAEGRGEHLVLTSLSYPPGSL